MGESQVGLRKQEKERMVGRPSKVDTQLQLQELQVLAELRVLIQNPVPEKLWVLMSI
jgi:hypothetical protein